jgi:cation diffusion facilitator CzcD-associated flavoprotein CzcO
VTGAPETTTPPSHVDVLVVGAGLSGICAAYHLQASCPNKTYAIFEGRDRLGGTWDLFRYPGIRSDSDMYTLGFSFRPWTNPKAIADGPAILAYIRETAEAYGIDRKIRYGHRVERARWSSRDEVWTVEALDVGTGRRVVVTCNFLFMCAGYYDYEEGYTPEFPGRERFGGTIVHPQKWGPDVAYEGKRVVVIGSGATAVTLVPELAKRAAHVTMLQRSPTYITSLPAQDPVADWMRGRVPDEAAYAITRWKNVLMGMAFYQACRRFPDRAKRLLVGQVKKQLRDTVDVDPHFTPSYDPWDQRLCLVPNGDLFKALRDGRASVVTDHIDTFTERGIRLRSGDELEADVIVSATGLKLKFLGGLDVEVDGKHVEPSKTMAYKGMMLSDVPNLALAIGYTNASWTLKCELTAMYVCRLLKHMEEHGYARCSPRRNASVTEEPLLTFSSGYVQRAIHAFPRQGSRAPWRVYQNYALDRLMLKRRPVDDGEMDFTRARR